MKNDRQLRDDVLAELDFDPSVHAEDIAVTAKQGIVTLSGTVLSFAQKRTAETAARRVSGVRAIAEELKVALPTEHQLDDADIARAALQLLDWDVFVPHNRVNVKVDHGWLTLGGDVDLPFQRAHAEAAVEHLLGIEGVSNRITVKSTVTPKAIKSKIEGQLQRRASADARKIQVEAEGGRVTLRGEIATWAEHDEALRAATFVPGVVEVKDLLTVTG